MKILVIIKIVIILKASPHAADPWIASNDHDEDELLGWCAWAYVYINIYMYMYAHLLIYLSIYLFFECFSVTPNQRELSSKNRKFWKKETSMRQINANMIWKVWLKNDPEWSPGGPLEAPWTTPRGPTGPPGRDPDPCWRSHKNQLKRWNVQRAQESPFLDPAGTQKSTTDLSLAQKVMPGIDFSSMLPANIVFSLLGLIFHRFALQINEIFDAFLQSCAHFS